MCQITIRLVEIEKARRTKKEKECIEFTKEADLEEVILHRQQFLCQDYFFKLV